jgi:hypothetical protein
VPRPTAEGSAWFSVGPEQINPSDAFAVLRRIPDRGWWSSDPVAPLSAKRIARSSLKQSIPADVQLLLDVVNGDRLPPDHWLAREMRGHVRTLAGDPRAALHYCAYESYPSSRQLPHGSPLADLRASAWRGLRWLARTGMADQLAQCSDTRCRDWMIVSYKRTVAGSCFCSTTCRSRFHRAQRHT